MKQLYTVYGNCQAEQLPSFLNTSKNFSENFEYLPIVGMYRMTDLEFSDFLNRLPDLDLLIYQNVSAARGKFAIENILSRLNKSALKMSIPSLFFTGYNPEVTYIRLREQGMLFYHDRNLYQRIKDNLVERYKHELLKDERYFPENFSQTCLDLTLNELKMREINQKIDIVISDFIEENYQIHRLFHILNHPSSLLLRELANRILSTLGISDKCQYNGSINPLENFQFPIYRSHYLNLGIQFDNPSNFVFDGISYTVEDFIASTRIRYSGFSDSMIEENSKKFCFTVPQVRGWDLAMELIF